MFDTEGALDVYVFCFSEHERNNTDGILAMWRGYGSHGNGAALIFDAGVRLDTPDEPAIPFLMLPVKYGTHEQREKILDDILNRWSEIAHSVTLPDELLYVAAYSFFHALKIFALTTKHDGFREEKEWRLIYIPEIDSKKLLMPHLSYAIGVRGVEPKLKFNLKAVADRLKLAEQLKDTLVQIILGPTVSSHLSVLATKRMLEKINKPELCDRVVASSIPLRPKND